MKALETRLRRRKFVEQKKSSLVLTFFAILNRSLAQMVLKIMTPNRHGAGVRAQRC